MKKTLKIINIALWVIILVTGFIRLTTEMFLTHFNSVKQTVIEQREIASDAELTAVIDTIVLENQKLEFLQSLNIGWNSLMFPKDFNKVKRIR